MFSSRNIHFAILGIILGYTTRLEDWKKHPERMPEAIKVIRDAVGRGATLVQQLLTSARQTDARLVPLDLNQLCHELEHMLAATFPKTISFDTDEGSPRRRYFEHAVADPCAVVSQPESISGGAEGLRTLLAPIRASTPCSPSTT